MGSKMHSRNNKHCVPSHHKIMKYKPIFCYNLNKHIYSLLLSSSQGKKRRLVIYYNLQELSSAKCKVLQLLIF